MSCEITLLNDAERQNIDNLVGLTQDERAKITKEFQLSPLIMMQGLSNINYHLDKREERAGFEPSWIGVASDMAYCCSIVAILVRLKN